MQAPGPRARALARAGRAAWSTRAAEAAELAGHPDVARAVRAAHAPGQAPGQAPGPDSRATDAPLTAPGGPPEQHLPTRAGTRARAVLRVGARGPAWTDVGAADSRAPQEPQAPGQARPQPQAGPQGTRSRPQEARAPGQAATRAGAPGQGRQQPAELALDGPPALLVGGAGREAPALVDDPLPTEPSGPTEGSEAGGSLASRGLPGSPTGRLHESYGESKDSRPGLTRKLSGR
jgi:hypothetical protein